MPWEQSPPILSLIQSQLLCGSLSKTIRACDTSCLWDSHCCQQDFVPLTRARGGMAPFPQFLSSPLVYHSIYNILQYLILWGFCLLFRYVFLLFFCQVRISSFLFFLYNTFLGLHKYIFFLNFLFMYFMSIGLTTCMSVKHMSTMLQETNRGVRSSGRGLTDR